MSEYLEDGTDPRSRCPISRWWRVYREWTTLGYVVGYTVEKPPTRSTLTLISDPNANCETQPVGDRSSNIDDDDDDQSELAKRCDITVQNWPQNWPVDLTELSTAIPDLGHSPFVPDQFGCKNLGCPTRAPRATAEICYTCGQRMVLV